MLAIKNINEVKLKNHLHQFQRNTMFIFKLLRKFSRTLYSDHIYIDIVILLNLFYYKEICIAKSLRSFAIFMAAGQNLSPKYKSVCM